MTVPAVNIGWNKYEVVLLIDAYIRQNRGEMTRKAAVSEVSRRLRCRMKRLGMTISDTFRNENGIALQMSAIEYLFTDGQKGIGHPSNIFREMVDTYNEVHEYYESLMEKANMMYPADCEEETPFEDNPQQMGTVASEQIADVRLEEELREILKANFTKGFRLGSFMDSKRMRSFYQERYGKELSCSDDELDDSVRHCGIEHDGRLYLPELMLPDSIRHQLTDHILQCFTNGIRCVYYSVLYEKYRQDFLDHHMLSPTMLRQYLEQTNEYGWRFWTDYLTESQYDEADIVGEVLLYVKEQGVPVLKGNVVQAFPQYPRELVEQAFDQNPQILISCGRNIRFHSANFVVDIDDMKQIAAIIEKNLSTYGFISFMELMNEMRTQMPGFVADNEVFTEVGMRKVISIVLGDKFSFANNLISKKGKTYTVENAFRALSRREYFTISDVVQLAASFNTIASQYLEIVLQESVRVDSTNFVNKRFLGFDVDAIDSSLLEICPNAYLPMNENLQLYLLPECGYKWNLFLLESYLTSYSKAFYLAHARFNQEKVNGAIVNRTYTMKHPDGHILDFDSILSLALITLDPLEKGNAIDYLVEKGFLASRRYAKIDDIIATTIMLRGKLGLNK